MVNLAWMKVIPFRIPKNKQEAFRLQEEHVPNLYGHLHQHPEMQITAVYASEGTLIAGDYIGRFSAGSVFVISGNLPHVFRNDSTSALNGLRAKTISLYFDQSAGSNPIWNLPELKSLLPYMNGNYGAVEILGNKAKSVMKSLQELKEAKGVARMILFLAILSNLESRKEVKMLSGMPQVKNIKNYDGNRMNNVLEYTFSNFHRPIGLKEIADMANLTPEAFCKYFKTRTRKTYFTFLNEVRIQHAKRLLLQENSPVSSVAWQSGFGNLSHFNRTFRKIQGCSPSIFRLKNNSSI